MPSPTEQARTDDKRTAPEIINGIQRRLQQGGNINTSAIIEDISVVDRIAQHNHPAGVFGFAVISEYFQAIGKHVPEVREALLARESTATGEEGKRQLDRLKEIIIPTTSQRYNHLRQSLYGNENAESLDKTIQPLLDQTARETTGVGVDPRKSVFGILLANLHLEDSHTSAVVTKDKRLPKERALTREVSSLMDPEITTDKAKVLGRAIEILAEGSTSQELISQLMLGLRMNHHFRDLTLSNYEKDEVIFLFQLPKAAQDSKKEILSLDVNLPGLSRTVQVLMETLNQIQGREANPLLAEIATSLREISQSPLLQEVNNLTQDPNLKNAPPPSHLNSYYWVMGDKKKTEGITVLNLKDGQGGIARRMIEAAAENPEDCQKLENTTIRLLSLLYLAHFQGEMKSRLTDIASPQSNLDMEVVEARNLHRLLLSAVLGGKPLSQVTQGDIRPRLSKEREETSLPATTKDFESILFGREVHWPADFSSQDSLAYFRGLSKAIEGEKSISLKFMPDKPVIILTGPNGSGKSSAENTIANSLALAAVTRTNPGAKMVKLSELMTNIRRSDPAISTNVTSTFQSEALFLTEALGKLGKGDILFLDEVGRGTDSRDATSLGQGIETYCIENGINLVVASHYGPQLLELSERLGTRDLIRVLRVDPETRQLAETDYAGKSMGVEVFRQRAEGKIPAKILEPLVHNALAIRQASLSKGNPELVPFPATDTTESTITYADDESLRDMNIYGNILGTVLRLTTDQIQTTVHRRDAWATAFLSQVKTITSARSEEELRPIHTLIDDLVKNIPTETLETFTLESARSFEGVSALYPRRLETLTPSQPDHLLKATDEFFRFYDTPEKRQAAFNHIYILGKQLTNSGNHNLIQLGSNMQNFAGQAWERLNSTMEPLEAAKSDQEILMTQMKKQAANAIRAQARAFNTEQEASIRSLLGETQSGLGRLVSRSNPEKFFQDLAKRIDAGDQKAYGAFSQFTLRTTGLPSGLTNTSGLRTLYDLAATLGSRDNQQVIVDSEELPSSFSADTNLTDFIMRGFYSGDLGPLFKAVRIVANIDKEATIYQRNQPIKELAKTIKLLESEKALAGMKAVADFRPQSEPISSMAYYTSMLNTIRQLSWSKVVYDEAGNVEVKNGQPLALLASKKIDGMTRQSFVIPAEADATVAVGLNGGGKTQLLMQMAGIFYWDKLTGYGSGDAITLPKNRVEFLACMVNSGQSTESKSSAQNEFDRQIDFLTRYLEAGAPKNGYVFFDEPGASTSSEDQIGILGALINFYQSREVKVIFTNHNHNTYDMLRKINVNFSAIGFLRQNGRATYEPTAYNPDEIEKVPSEGINVAEELRLDNKIIQVARLARQIIDEYSTQSVQI